MQQENTLERERIERSLRMITECSDVLFDHSSVMMHSINREGELVKVNRRWLATLGYSTSDVLGHKSVDFLTDECREQIVTDALPLFWAVRSARSIGCRMVRRNGRVISVLLDSDAMDDGEGDLFTLTTLRAPDDRTQWQQASVTLGTLHKTGHVQRQLEGMLSAQEAGQAIASDSPLPSSSVPTAQVEPLSDLMTDLVEVGAGSLRNSAHHGRGSGTKA